MHCTNFGSEKACGLLTSELTLSMAPYHGHLGRLLTPGVLTRHRYGVRSPSALFSIMIYRISKEKFR